MTNRLGERQSVRDKAGDVLVVSSEFGRLNLQIPAHGLLNRGGAEEMSVPGGVICFSALLRRLHAQN